jgi:hypothetical protein
VDGRSCDSADCVSNKIEITATVPATRPGTNSSTHLDIADPLSHTILLAFDIHYSWRTATAQQDENIMERG